MRICDLRQKEVINICPCRSLGCVNDADIDSCTGADCPGSRKTLFLSGARHRVHHPLEVCETDWE